MPAEPTVREREAKPTSPKPAPLGCPVCGGALVPQRGSWRCMRCGMGLCLGCEPEACYDPQPSE